MKRLSYAFLGLSLITFSVNVIAETQTFNKGKELMHLDVSGPGAYGYNQIFVAGGTNPISDQAWETYAADIGYYKNPTRRPLFVNSPFPGLFKIVVASTRNFILTMQPSRIVLDSKTLRL